ncbi:MAG TPA: hypothetical protein VFS87_06915, partial [Qipengyuania sp.]|nr:hypothetical protein [Qipengyuania sp.]
MGMSNDKVHILDKDVKRRAMIAYGLSSKKYNAQVYENLEEVVNFPPRDGFLLVNDSFAGEEMAYVTGVIAANLARVPVIVFGEHPSTSQVVNAM